MFRKLFGAIFQRTTQPFFQNNIALNKQMDLAEQLLKLGEKDKALKIYKEIYQKDSSYKPVYGRIVELEQEIKETKSNQPDFTAHKSKQ